MAPTLLSCAGFVASFASCVLAQDHVRKVADGFQHFVTRPDLAAPRYRIAKHHPEAITPGYLFVGTYYVTAQENREIVPEYIPCQVGPQIITTDGELVWSGACDYDNRSVFDFRPVDINGTHHLSFWLSRQYTGTKEDIPVDDRSESGIILNAQYKEVSRLVLPRMLDCHEFHPQPDGKTILHTWIQRQDWIMSTAEFSHAKGKIINGGFRHTDPITQTAVFNWDPLEHGMDVHESYDTTGGGWVGTDDLSDAWDWLHINGVVQTDLGDYLVSARHTMAIYKVSGVDGHVIWRLGGKKSDFLMDDDVPFSWQHNVQFLGENATHTILSTFDNGSEDKDRNTTVPQTAPKAKIILLNTASRPMTAQILRLFDQPGDGKASAGGSFMLLGENPETANVLVNWVKWGQITEHDSEGRMVFQAKFDSDTLKGYRVYKGAFVGKPTEPPAFKFMPLSVSRGQIVSAFYVSWNGATEVAFWEFHGCNGEDEEFVLLERVPKRGFETVWTTTGLVERAYAEAFDADGNSLGRSPTERISLTGAWQDLDGMLDSAVVQEEWWDEGRVLSSATVVSMMSPVWVVLFGLLCLGVLYCCWQITFGRYMWRRGYLRVETFDDDREKYR